jgi:hypothetical protein
MPNGWAAHWSMVVPVIVEAVIVPVMSATAPILLS